MLLPAQYVLICMYIYIYYISIFTHSILVNWIAIFFTNSRCEFDHGLLITTLRSPRDLFSINGRCSIAMFDYRRVPWQFISTAVYKLKMKLQTMGFFLFLPKVVIMGI